jgi:hypothetical protein
MCCEFENAQWLRKDFIQKCKEKKLWLFDEDQVIGEIPERLLWLYKIE